MNTGQSAGGSHGAGQIDDVAGVWRGVGLSWDAVSEKEARRPTVLNAGSAPTHTM